jgi:hypothetical protein
MKRDLVAFALCVSVCSPAIAQQRDAAWARSKLAQADSTYTSAVEKALALLDSAIQRKDLLTPEELAVAYQRRSLWLGAMAPRNASPASQPQQSAQVRIGSATAGAFIYVDDALLGPLATVRYWSVPAGRPFRLSIRSVNCKTPWDTVMTLAAGSTTTIGRRHPRDCT